MKKIMVLALLVVVCLASVASAKVIQLKNNTEIIVEQIYLSHSGTDDWEDDILGSEVLNPGEGYQIDISGPAEWDIKLVGENGAEAIFYNVDFNKYTVVTLNKDGSANGQ